MRQFNSGFSKATDPIRWFWDGTRAGWIYKDGRILSSILDCGYMSYYKEYPPEEFVFLKEIAAAGYCVEFEFKEQKSQETSSAVHKCNCDFTLLLQKGCRCGGI